MVTRVVLRPLTPAIRGECCPYLLSHTLAQDRHLFSGCFSPFLGQKVFEKQRILSHNPECSAGALDLPKHVVDTHNSDRREPRRKLSLALEAVGLLYQVAFALRSSYGLFVFRRSLEKLKIDETGQNIPVFVGGELSVTPMPDNDVMRFVVSDTETPTRQFLLGPRQEVPENVLVDYSLGQGLGPCPSLLSTRTAQHTVC